MDQELQNNIQLLANSERELSMVRYALDHSAIVAITDQMGNIIHVNDKFCEISQYSREELVGKNHRILNSAYHSLEFFKELWKTIAQGQIWEGEIRNRAKSGSYYWVHTTIVPFLNDQGKPYQYVSIRYEITQRKYAEEQLLVYADQLEQKNKELEKSLQEITNREEQILVQDRLASIGLLASSLAHEIGTPLGVIRGRAEFLEMQLRDNLSVKKNVDVIVSQIDRVAKLIRSLLNLARGDETQKVESVNAVQVVADVIELMAHECSRSGIEIENRLQGELVVKASSGPLHQVLLNLLVNSVHAIESAKKTGRLNHYIRIQADSDEKNITLVLADSGCGISEKNLKNIFQAFFTTKDIGEGTGLGLATSYKIIQGWGGVIGVSSTENVGTEFKITLPKV